MLNDYDHKMQALAALRKAVANALERKRRLGQYAVVWRDGRAQRIEPGLLDESSGVSLSSSNGTIEARETGKDQSDRRGGSR